ncbi:monovalent cation/H+ antiporter subunit D family protein [Ornithinicoccus halotolerans]|uniref:monovalent cation/H+ antiporter subunit D family protein n=1 Tax=Ornithinicoccus halotolerans TaxID=1748220 RepID=UPI00129500BD|nr:monovalent cation/H+ antiporter subunit D family protein [Ornithinicoccus halotolerans]
MNHALLALFPVVPLLSAALTVLMRQTGFDRVFTVGVPLVSAAGGVGLLLLHRTEPVIAHNVGGFEPGIAIPLVSDTFSALMITVTSLTTAVTMTYLAATGEDKYRFVPPLALMLLAGVNGALLTGDLFNLFVFIEVMLLPSYALIAVTGTWRRLGVGRLFVLVSLLTSTLLLMGVAMLYAAAGTVNLAALAGRAADEPWTGFGVALVLLALAIKSGVVPVHTWLPRAYPATSAGVMALFSALHTKVALYAIYRIYATAYGGEAPWWPLLVVAVGLTMVVGAYSTFGERIVRRALAFQMVTGIGHILLGLALFTQVGLAAGIFYMVHHIVIMGALLLSSGAVEQTYGTGRYDRLHGLIRRDPWVAAVVALGLFSLVGLPPSSGFFGKVGLVQATAATGVPWQQWTFIGLIIVASLGSLVALQRLWVGVFFGPDMETYRPDSARTGRGERIALPPHVRIGNRLLAPGAALLVVSLAMFVGAGVVVPFTVEAAASLLDPAAYSQAVLP